MDERLKKFRTPLLAALIVSLGLGAGLGWKLKRDRAAQLGVVTSSKKIRVLALKNSLPAQVLRGFRSVENIEVELAEEPSPEAIYAHLVRDPSFDLVTLLTSQTREAVQNSKMQPLKLADGAGFENVSRDFVDLPEKQPSTVPFLWGLLGFVYNPKTVQPVKTWAEVFELGQESKIRLKPLDLRGRGFKSSFPRTLTFLANPDLKDAEGGVVEVSFSEGTLPAYKDMNFILPKEGALLWILSLGVGAQARNVEDAKIFVSYILRPEVAIEISRLNHEASTNNGVERSGLLPTQKPSSLRRIPLTLIDLKN